MDYVTRDSSWGGFCQGILSGHHHHVLILFFVGCGIGSILRDRMYCEYYSYSSLSYESDQKVLEYRVLRVENFKCLLDLSIFFLSS